MSPCSVTATPVRGSEAETPYDRAFFPLPCGHQVRCDRLYAMVHSRRPSAGRSLQNALRSAAAMT
eukprot:11018267-Prorocentrum_lima.AAC.1